MAVSAMAADGREEKRPRTTIAINVAVGGRARLTFVPTVTWDICDAQPAALELRKCP